MGLDSKLPVAPNSDDHWQVIIIRHGTRETVRSEAYLNYSYYGEPDGPFRVDYYFWILRRGEQVVIVDTGYSAREAARRDRDVLVDPLDALTALGIDPEAGHPVIITHAHYDHIGNVAAFSKSNIAISRNEWDFWTDAIAEKTQFSHFGDSEALTQLHMAKDQERLTLFEDGFSPAPGIELSVLGGHTPGQAMVTVSTTEGQVILASDAVHFHEELERDMLFQSMANLPDSYRALELLRHHPQDLIVSGHDAGELEKHTPMKGPLSNLAATIGRIQ
jgi:glyoxylase-like metal-dependent hydrolase (beta-lactamase superfamily II)